MSALTGKTAKQQYNLAAEAQRKQEARIAEERTKVEAVEAGQRRVRTGGRGLLAFVDDDAVRASGLATSFGAAAS